MRTVTVTTKGRADNKAHMDSLFDGKGTNLRHARYDMGKYRPGAIDGRVAQVPDDVMALYRVRRKDRDGAYDALFCIVRK